MHVTIGGSLTNCMRNILRYSYYPIRIKEEVCSGLLTINEPVDYMARAVMILMWGKDIMQQ